MSAHVYGDREELKWLFFFLRSLRKRQTKLVNNNNNVIPGRKESSSMLWLVLEFEKSWEGRLLCHRVSFRLSSLKRLGVGARALGKEAIMLKFQNWWSGAILHYLFFPCTSETHSFSYGCPEPCYLSAPSPTETVSSTPLLPPQPWVWVPVVGWENIGLHLIPPFFHRTSRQRTATRVIQPEVRSGLMHGIFQAL